VFYTVQGQLQTAQGLAEHALRLAQRVQDAEGLAGAQVSLGGILFFRGELPAAYAHLAQSVNHYEPGPRFHPYINAEDFGVFRLRRTAHILWYLGYPDRAMQRSHEAHARARALSHPLSLATAWTARATLHQLRREAQRTQECAEASMALTREYQFAFRLAEALPLLGWALAMQGQGEAGLGQLHQGLDAGQATGAGLLRPYHFALLAEAYAQVGQPEVGLRVLAEGLTLSHRSGEHRSDAELYRLLGELWLQTGIATPELGGGLPPSPAACFRQALHVARHQQAKALELRAALSLSRLWQQQGKPSEARTLLAPIYGWFTEGFDTADLQEAKALLETLA
jgi:predicted ATPase